MRLEKNEPAAYVAVFCCVLVVLTGLAGCSHAPNGAASSGSLTAEPVSGCTDFFLAFDQAVQSSQARDAGSFPIKGYPYLRVNRFLASYGEDISTDDQFDAWVARLKELDRQARHYEIQNLTAVQRSALQAGSDQFNLEQTVATCGDLLASVRLTSVASRERLRQAAKAPDEYSSIKRLAGFYPLPLLFISDGVKRWQRSATESFSNTAPDKPYPRRYLPPNAGSSAANAADIVQAVGRDGLGIPVYSPQLELALFNIFAPVWEVETLGEFDQIGTPAWGHNRQLWIDVRKPVTFQLLSFTRFEGQVLTQLNYIVWFPSRPKKGPLDLLGGRLDGVNYRVTLDVDGQPLLFETVHSCGCYLAFYPTPRLVPRAATGCMEPPLLLKAPRLNAAGERMVISLASGDHQVRHLYSLSSVNAESDKIYAFAAYDDLRSLPVGAGGVRKSMFADNGLVAGTERLERWLLWPAGVASPGAMRQWGRHAVAFMGERHLDDPYLLQELFAYARR